MDRHRLAGEQRLVYGEAHRGDQDGIGGDAVALLEQDDIAADDIPSGDFLLDAVPDHRGARTRQVAKCVQGAFGFAFLVEGDAHDDEDKAHEHQGFLDIANEQVDDAAGNQQEEHRFLDHFQGDGENATRLALGQFVIAF